MSHGQIQTSNLYISILFISIYSHFAVLLEKSQYLMVPLLQTLTIIIEHQTYYIVINLERGTRIRNEIRNKERGSGTRNETLGRGTRNPTTLSKWRNILEERGTAI